MQPDDPAVHVRAHVWVSGHDLLLLTHVQCHEPVSDRFPLHRDDVGKLVHPRGQRQHRRSVHEWCGLHEQHLSPIGGRRHLFAGVHRRLHVPAELCVPASRGRWSVLHTRRERLHARARWGSAAGGCPDSSRRHGRRGHGHGRRFGRRRGRRRGTRRASRRWDDGDEHRMPVSNGRPRAAFDRALVAVGVHRDRRRDGDARATSRANACYGVNRTSDSWRAVMFATRDRNAPVDD